MTSKSKRLWRLGQAGVLALALVGITGAFSDITAVNETHASPDSLLGNYLAGRFAKTQRDTNTAANFYAKALAKDPGNERILEQTFLLAATAGDWSKALSLADDLVKSEPNHRVGRYLLGAKAVKNGNYAAAEVHFSAVGSGPIAALTTRLTRAWIALAQGKDQQAFKILAKSKKAEWSQFYQRYHKGLIADLAGRPRVARQAFAKAFEKAPRTLRLAQAYARHAAHAGDQKLAGQILATHIARSTGHALSLALQAEVKSGKKLDFLVTTPKDGIAEVFYGIGDALTGEGGLEAGTIYLQIALYLQPDSPLANIALGEVYESAEKYDLAIKVYDRIPKASPLRMNAQVRKGFSLNSLEKVDEAKVLLEKLANEFPTETRPLNAVGNIMRSHKRYGEAVTYYSRALSIVETPEKKHWRLYYARGVCHERLKDWPRAEADLQRAMELDGEQSLVLNYLGYTWVDKGTHLDKAMALIRKAVKLKPDDGYFVDSLGWAHYRLGEYEKAVEQLERAVELRPDDPVINDHLGDAYWQVERRTEAKFQWTQSLALKPEAADVDKIKRKLSEGLAPPTQTKAQVDKVDSGAQIKN